MCAATLTWLPLSPAAAPVPSCFQKPAAAARPSCRSYKRIKPSDLLLSRSPRRPAAAATAAAASKAEQQESTRLGEEGGEHALPEGLERETMPRHVAVIMDGNGRWAKARGLPTMAGHQEGVSALKEMVALSCKWGIRVLTVFAFSAENWLRPKAEVDFLVSLFENVIRADIGNFVREDIRLCVIGDSSKLPKSLQGLINEAEEMTKNNTRLDLLVAVSYSGRNDIIQACQKIAGKVKDGLLNPEDISESVIEKELETNCAADFPCPDLLIRTSGELRVSNFLLWQLAYTELFFTPSLWPDFGESDYAEALCAFQKRQRRFGLRA